jgi:hypothetical protein
MTALQWITKEAKKLRKEYPKRFATWREYVAQASAIYAKKHKGKSPVGKKHKVSGVKKKAVKKATPKSYHKDTKSHNVKISVMSGISKGREKMIKVWEQIYGNYARDYISTSNLKDKKIISKNMKVTKEIISDLKKLK